MEIRKALEATDGEAYGVSHSILPSFGEDIEGILSVYYHSFSTK